MNVIPREVNRDFLLKHGFTPRERVEVILGLRVENYIKGPEEDDRARGPKDIWFFGVEYEQVSIYIKLQLVEEKDAAAGKTLKHAKCISFHEAKWPMIYPYGGE
ncbi:MAG: hypothetical protein KGK30_04105 [Elusimicrobia bacterium]|nr:hypothetical protein [Elusimicrobiota bacterium]